MLRRSVCCSHTDWVFWPPLTWLWLVQWLSCPYLSTVILKLCEVCLIFVLSYFRFTILKGLCVVLEASRKFMLADSISKVLLATVVFCCWMCLKSHPFDCCGKLSPSERNPQPAALNKACIGNEERRGRSHLSCQVTIHSHIMKKINTCHFLYVVAQSSFFLGLLTLVKIWDIWYFFQRLHVDKLKVHL